jgi:pimeloyl-ACP methyl ester carboxylesterase
MRPILLAAARMTKPAVNAPQDLTFVPGAAGLGAFWEPVAERLPASWRMRCLDLPGLGSVPPRVDVQSYSDLTDHVARVIARPTVLVGQSMGGFVSLQLALRYPELVQRLVLVVATGGVDMARHGALDWRASDLEENPERAPWARAITPDLSGELHRIRAPVLLIWATRDVLSPLGVARELAEKLPQARLITFDTDDHWVARRFADETANALRQWLLD